MYFHCLIDTTQNFINEWMNFCTEKFSDMLCTVKKSRENPGSEVSSCTLSALS